MPPSRPGLAASGKDRAQPRCCSWPQRSVWGTRSVLQPAAEAVGWVLTRRAGSSPFPVDPEGERSEFREAETSRKSSTHSMAEHGARRVGRPAWIDQRAPIRRESVHTDMHLPAHEFGQPRPFLSWGNTGKSLPRQAFALFKPIIPTQPYFFYLTVKPDYPNLSRRYTQGVNKVYAHLHSFQITFASAHLASCTPI